MTMAVVEEEKHGQALPELEKLPAYHELCSLLNEARKMNFRIGQSVKDIVDSGWPLDHVARMGESFGVSQASMVVFYRWAKGDYGPEEVGRKAVAKIKHSILRDMTSDVVRASLTGKKVVYDPEQCRVVKQSFDEMPRATVSRNITVQGFKPCVQETPGEFPTARKCNAKGFSVERDGVSFESAGPDPIRMFVSKAQLLEAAEKIDPDANG